MKRPIVIIESPFRKKGEKLPDLDYILYLRRCLRDSWAQGEHPLASHAYYPFFLDESKESERNEGIEAGYRMWPLAQYIVFYTDYGMSPGMEKALDRAVYLHRDVRTRAIGPNP